MYIQHNTPCEVSAIFVYYMSVLSLTGLWLTLPGLVLISFLTGLQLLFIVILGCIIRCDVVQLVITHSMLGTSLLILFNGDITNPFPLFSSLFSSINLYVSLYLLCAFGAFCYGLLVLSAWRCPPITQLPLFVHIDKILYMLLFYYLLSFII